MQEWEGPTQVYFETSEDQGKTIVEVIFTKPPQPCYVRLNASALLDVLIQGIAEARDEAAKTKD